MELINVLAKNDLFAKDEQKGRKSQEGMGYVESLIALVIAGIACVALLSLASAVIREAANNTMRDSLNQYATEGMEKVRVIADEDIEQIPSPAVGSETYCLNRDPGCCDGGDCDERGALIEVVDSCSENGRDGECGMLDTDGDGDFEMYREVEVSPAGCGSVKVVLNVGMLEEGRSVKSSVEVTGIIGGLDVEGCSITGASCNPPCEGPAICDDGECVNVSSCDHPDFSCGQNATCGVGGECLCDTGWANCDPDGSNWDNGCESNLNSDEDTCGDCINRCGDTESCVDGTCELANGRCYRGTDCGENYSECNGTWCECNNLRYRNCNNDWSDGCETNIFTDDNNCGACGDRCTYGYCENRRCFLNPGYCYDLSQCGEYFSYCRGGEGSVGACDCLVRHGNCNGDWEDGCEIDLFNDDENCGDCGVVCDSDEACDSGFCISTIDGGGNDGGGDGDTGGGGSGGGKIIPPIFPPGNLL
jgi:Tfp pilus assembly protein PilV